VCCEDSSLGSNMSHHDVLSCITLTHRPAVLIAALQAHNHSSITVCKSYSTGSRILECSISHVKKSYCLFLVLNRDAVSYYPVGHKQSEEKGEIDCVLHIFPFY